MEYTKSVVVDSLLPSIQKRKKERYLGSGLAGIVATLTILYTTCSWVSNYNKKNAHNKKYKEIPEPGSAYPYVGHFLSLGNVGKTIAKWHDELGPIIKLRMGVKTWIIVADPAMAHQIFVKNGAHTSNRPESDYATNYHSLKGKGLAYGQPGPSFNKYKSAALSVLQPKTITDKYMDKFKQEAYNLVSRLLETSEIEGGVDPLKDLELNSMNVIVSVCIGKKYESIKDEEFIHLSETVEEIMDNGGVKNDLAKFLPIVAVYDYFFDSKKAKMRDFIFNKRNPTFTKLVEDAMLMEGPNVVKSFEEDGFGFTTEEKMVLIADIICGGTDTNSVTMRWFMAILCHYPETQKKVSDEIDQFIKKNGRIPDFSDRLEVPFCISVLKECIRFRPTGLLALPHIVTKDIEVDGYLIPEGTTVLPNVNHMHYYGSTYADPYTFNPERFMNSLRTMYASANGKFEDRDHYNFGFGRRMCPGIYFSEVGVFCAFIQIFSRATIEPADGKIPDIESTVTKGITSDPLPFKVKFVKRKDALIV